MFTGDFGKFTTNHNKASGAEITIQTTADKVSGKNITANAGAGNNLTLELTATKTK